MSIFGKLLDGYRAGDARRPGRELVPSSQTQAFARSGGAVEQWGGDYRARSPAEYQPGPRLIRRRLYSPQVRIETAHGTFYFKDYCEESEWSE